MKNWTVYEHITPSGKRYIGITSKKPEERWRNGRGYNPENPFGKAIEKYGWNDIQHNILFNDLTEKEAKWLENYLICYYSTYVGFKDCKGYNCTLGGDGVCGLTPMKGKHHTEETKLKIGKPHKGIKFSDEHRRRISESNKGKQAWNKGIPSQFKGIPRDEETKRKISESHKGKPGWNKGKHCKPHTEEEKRKISESHKGKHRVYHEDGTFHMER